MIEAERRRRVGVSTMPHKARDERLNTRMGRMSPRPRAEPDWPIQQGRKTANQRMADAKDNGGKWDGPVGHARRADVGGRGGAG